MKYFYGEVTGAAPSTEPNKLTGRYSPSGNEVADDAALVGGVPTIFQGPARESLMTRHFREDRNSVISSHGAVNYTQKPGEWYKGERLANIMNFKTTDQAEQQRNFHIKLYNEKVFMNQKRDLKKHGMEQLLKAIDAKKQGDMKRYDYLMDQARANLIKLKKVSPTDFKGFSTEILKGIQKETDTAEETAIKQIARSKDAGEIVMLFNTLRTINVDQKKP